MQIQRSSATIPPDTSEAPIDWQQHKSGTESLVWLSVQPQRGVRPPAARAEGPKTRQRSPRLSMAADWINIYDRESNPSATVAGRWVRRSYDYRRYTHTARMLPMENDELRFLGWLAGFGVSFSERCL